MQSIKLPQGHFYFEQQTFYDRKMWLPPVNYKICYCKICSLGGILLHVMLDLFVHYEGDTYTRKYVCQWCGSIFTHTSVYDSFLFSRQNSYM